MVLAVEILIGTLPMANLIKDGKVFQIPSMMQTGKSIGMRQMDDSLLSLVEEGRINTKNTIMYAANKNRFKPLLERQDNEPAA